MAGEFTPERDGVMRRYFLSFYDDTLNGLTRHDSGYLVNRKPVVFSFMGQRAKEVRRQ